MQSSLKCRDKSTEIVIVVEFFLPPAFNDTISQRSARADDGFSSTPGL